MPFCSPDSIIIPEGRFRTATTEDKEVIDMANSIKECGQLQPALVTKNMELVDGLHRVLACKRLDRDVWWEDEDTAKVTLSDPIQRRRAELQANIRRSNFTPLQLANGIAELDRLMRDTYGEKKSGPSTSGEGWTSEETAKMLGYKSHASVLAAKQVAAAASTGSVPALSEAKTMAEATKMVKDAARMEAIKELARRQSLIGNGEIEDPLKHFGEKVILGDCLEGMKSLPPGICSLFITDPPFGIDLNKIIADRGEVLGQVQTVYEDDEADILSLVKGVCHEIARVGKPSCQVVMFCATQFWHILNGWFADLGFFTLNKPLVWVKANKVPFKMVPGRTSNPATRPGSAYEVAVLAWRGTATLAKQGLSDVFIHASPPSASRIHIAQKPISLMVEIIERFLHPQTNPLLIDPFVGSASTLIAAQRLEMKQYFGYELNPEFRERAVARMVREYVKDKDEEEEFDFEGFE